MDEGRSPGHAWLVILAGTTLWYAWPQLPYSLYVAYDVLRSLFPAWVAPLEPVLHSILEGG